MQQNWWESDPVARPRQPVGMAPGPKAPPMQAPAEAELTQGHIAQLPLQTEQMRTQIDNTRANMGQIPLQNKQTQTSIATGEQQLKTAQLSNQQSLRTEFEKRPEVQNYRMVLPMFASAIRAGDNPVGDLQIITAWAKTVDPTGSVREGDVAAAQDAQSRIDKIKAEKANWDGSGRLRPNVREHFLTEIRNRSQRLADMYNQTRQYFGELANGQGFDPNVVIGPHPGAQYQQAEADFLGRPIHNLDGSQGAAPHWQQAQPPQFRVQTPIDPTGEGDIGFNNGGEVAALPPHAMDAQKDIEAQIVAGKLHNFAEVSAYAKSKWNITFSNDEKQQAAINAAMARGQNPGMLTPQWLKPDISDMRGRGGVGESADAAIRGAADVPTMGLADEAAAAADTIFRGGTMRYNLARQRAVDDYDTQNHPYLRLGGQIAGGLALPVGEIGGAADLARVGAGYGAAYGFGSGRGNIGDRLLGGVEGGVAGAATAPLLQVAGKGVGAAARKLFGSRPATPPPLLDAATGRLNAPLQSASPAQRMAAAREYGIDLPLDAATDKGGAIIAKGLDILPASAGVMNDSRRALAGQVDNAVENLAGRYGSATSLDAAGQAAQRGAQNWIGRFENVSSRAYNAIPVSDKAPAVTASTKATLEQLTTAFESNPKLADQMRNPTLVRYLDALNSGGLSWKDLKALRSHIGDQIGEERFSDSPSRGQLRALYGALSEDMRATAASQGPRALHAFERANSLYAAGQQRIEGALVRILGDNSRNNPEAAAAAIQTIAKSGRGSANIRQLQQIRASLAKGDEWNEVASSLIRLIGQPANSAGRDFNPETFVRNYADMSEPARNLLFGDRGRADLRRALDGFVAVNQRLAGTNALRNTSNTALGMTGSGTVLTAAAGLLNPVFGAKVAGGMAANYGMAKLWTNPNFVRWATGYTRLMATGNQNAVRSHVGRLATLATKEPSLQEPLVALQQRLLGAVNDNFGFSATASGSDDQQRRQQR